MIPILVVLSKELVLLKKKRTISLAKDSGVILAVLTIFIIIYIIMSLHTAL